MPLGNAVSESGATPTLRESHGALAVFDLPAQAVTLAHSLEPLIVWGETSQYGSHGYEGVKITDVAVRKGADPMYVDQCLGKLLVLCDPCEHRFAAQKLAELRVLTAHRARDGVDTELMATAYTQRLATYPADIVAAACDAWTNANQFWPTWSELKNECDKRMSGRKQLRDALVRWRPA
jgi:hypothetical protein